MKPNWNTPRTKEGLQIPESYLKKDAATQNRRELTFLLQEAAFAEHIPIYCVIDMEQLSDGEQKLFHCDNFSCRAAILLGFPVKEIHLFMEQQIPDIDGSRTETMAELKVKNYLLNYSDKLQLQGYQVKMLLPPIIPDFDYARMLAASKKGFVGKGGRFITKGYGCQMLIGILLTDAPLMGGDYRYPDYSGNGCGNCNMCQLVCPVNALSFTGFDRERCLAYRDDPNNQLRIAEHTVRKCMRCMECCIFGSGR